MRLVAMILSAGLLAGVAAAPATAQNAPPGNSGIDEYVETVPAGGGDRPTASHGGNHQDALPPSTTQALDQEGQDGALTARLANATAPDKGGASKAHASGQSGDLDAVNGRLDGDSGRSPLLTVVDAVLGRGDSGGMGALLPILLAASLFFAVALAARRSRSQ